MFNDPYDQIIQERFGLLPIEPQCYLIYSTTIICRMFNAIHLLYQKKKKKNYNNCIYYILFYKYYHSNCTGMFNDPIIQERFWLLPIEPQCYLIYSTTI